MTSHINQTEASQIIILRQILNARWFMRNNDRRAQEKLTILTLNCQSLRTRCVRNLSAYLFHTLRLIPVVVNSKQNYSHVVTLQMDIIYRQTSGMGMASQDIEDICVAECIFENGQTV
ncbi:UNVERIFIED_CONTAM: hypothetical protein NCL1_26340 [Trichonephila clavipes]